MSDKKKVRSTGKLSQREILKARGHKPRTGEEKIHGRLQRRIDRLRKMGVIASGFLPKDVCPSNTTRRKLDEAEAKFNANLAKYDKF